MYQITCDDYILYDPRDPDLMLLDPRFKVAVNTIGEASFTILRSHPYVDKLKKLKSIVEIKNDGDIVFRGRITNDCRDLYNQMTVDIEGMLGVTNDTLIAPFSFPDDVTITSGDNVVAVFLGWVLAQHNAQVPDFQKLKLGTVTVSDPNNVIVRSSEKYLSTWEVLKSRLFESALGGYMYARYEADGTYIDYVSSFALTNTQPVELTENLLDIVNEYDATETYTACLPMGAELEKEVPIDTPTPQDEEDDPEEEIPPEEEEPATEIIKYQLTLEELPDGDLTPDIVKRGLYIYSKRAVEQYGWICAPIDDSTWSDVTEVQNLKTKAITWLSGSAVMLQHTISIKAVDLHLTDDEIQRFRPFRNVIVNSIPHGQDGISYPMTEMEVQIQNLQDTLITVGDIQKTLMDTIEQSTSEAIQRVEEVSKDIADNRYDVSQIKQQMMTQSTEIINTANEIIMGALTSYVETGNFEQFKQTVEAQLQVMSSEIILKFTNAETYTQNVDGDLLQTNNLLSKYFEFTQNGLTIKSGSNDMTLTLDNDKISFKKNGVQFGYWDGVDFFTGNVIVEVNERAQFGNFAYIPRSDGSLMFLKVR